MTYAPKFFRPLVPNPYPGDFRRVTDFRFASRLSLAREPNALVDRRRNRVRFALAQPYTVSFRVDEEFRDLTVPRGLLVDFSNVPRAGQRMALKMGPHLEGIVVHAFLSVAWQLIPGRQATREDFRFARAVLFAAMTAARAPRRDRAVLRWVMRMPGARACYDEERDPIFVELDPMFFTAEHGLLDHGGKQIVASLKAG